MRKVAAILFAVALLGATVYGTWYIQKEVSGGYYRVDYGGEILLHEEEYEDFLLIMGNEKLHVHRMEVEKSPESVYVDFSVSFLKEDLDFPYGKQTFSDEWLDRTLPPILMWMVTLMLGTIIAARIWGVK